MKEILQNIIFPNLENENLKRQYQLFYRGVKGALLEENGSTVLYLPDHVCVEFNTYFNGLSMEKWKRYTDVLDFSLQLTVKGSFQLRVVGFVLNGPTPETSLLFENDYSYSEPFTLSVPIPDNECRMVAFEIVTKRGFALYSGNYVGNFTSSNDVNLSIATTTCRKEKFIISNVNLLKDKILDQKEELAKHLFIHIVDNGRTLEKKNLPDHPQIFLHPNKNVGGSGGFARGMMESLHQKETITHVLLMDDDVMLQPESIRKTYVLLKHLKPEYQDSFISGAMLYLENLHIQKEDIGTVGGNASFRPLKREFNQEFLWDNLKNEEEYPLAENSYAAWWYCCIPVKTIRENGLPMPLFVRGDDVEYGLRCKPKHILTMNGICVWHMGFAGKFNANMDFYQVNRNLFIVQAMGTMPRVNVYEKSRWDFERLIYRFDYSSAELCIRAMKDYLQGPEYISVDRGEEILKENSNYVHKMVPLENFGGDPYADVPMPIILRTRFFFTKNGVFGLRHKYDERPAFIPFNDSFLPGKIAYKSKLYAVNMDNRSGYLLTRDDKKARQLYREYKTVEKKIKSENDRLHKEYEEAKNVFTTEDFWRKYLDI